jgi:hypothetical protein
MKNAHHQLLHAFPTTLWGFPNPKGNTSKLGFDLDSIIHLLLKKNVKFLRLVFSFALGHVEL